LCVGGDEEKGGTHMSFDKEQLNKQYALSEGDPFFQNCPYQNTAFGQRVFERLSERLPYPIKTGTLSLSGDCLTVYLYAETDTLCILKNLFSACPDHFSEPKEHFVRDLLQVLDDAAQEFGLPMLSDILSSDARVYLHISDFRSAMICADFGSRCAEISREVRYKCHQYNVTVCTGQWPDRFFMLVYDTEWQRRLAKWTGHTKRVAEMVLALCRENDPHGVYADDGLVDAYSVTSKERLRHDGHMMGVMRNNEHMY
jgi:hypothetical protein